MKNYFYAVLVFSLSFATVATFAKAEKPTNHFNQNIQSKLRGGVNFQLDLDFSPSLPAASRVQTSAEQPPYDEIPPYIYTCATTVLGKVNFRLWDVDHAYLLAEQSSPWEVMSCNGGDTLELNSASRPVYNITATFDLATLTGLSHAHEFLRVRVSDQSNVKFSANASERKVEAVQDLDRLLFGWYQDRLDRNNKSVLIDGSDSIGRIYH